MKVTDLLIWPLLAVVGLLISCSTFDDLVQGEDMLRVLETGADAGAGAPLLGNGKANVGSCRMERTGELPPGTKFEYNGDKCNVKVITDGP